jgi:hypothetical protein
VVKKLSISAAKELLVHRILDQAERDGLELSEVERKMLYFSGSIESLPEMAEASAAFDREYDQDKYEAKIAGLVRKILADRSPENEEKLAAWDNAVLRLSDEDHYVLVLILGAEGPNSFITLEPPTVRPPHDRLRLFATAAAIVFGVFAIAAAANMLLR